MGMAAHRHSQTSSWPDIWSMLFGSLYWLGYWTPTPLKKMDCTWSSAPLILSLLRQNHLLRSAMFDVPKKSAILAYKIADLILLTSCLCKRSPITCNAAMASGPYNLPSTDRLSHYASLFSVYFQIIKKHTEFQGLGIKITDKKKHVLVYIL